MKFLLIASLCVFSFGALAQQGDFATKKQMKLSHIDQMIEALESNKDCIQNANTEDALQQCREQRKQAMEDMKEKKKEWKKQKEESSEEKELMEY